MTKPGFTVLIRDTILFVLGIVIIARQAGIYYPPPDQVSIPLLITAGICCNIPAAIQVLQWRLGSTESSSSRPGSAQSSPPLPSSSSGEP